MSRPTKSESNFSDSLFTIRQYLNLGGDDLSPSSILDDLRKQSESCQMCSSLYPNGNVFECGKRTSKLMLVGEAPAKTEVNTKVLFSGPAGMKLNDILALPLVEINRSECYLVNALKCKLPGGPGKAKLREPHLFEIAKCAIYLQGQMLCVNPVLVVLMGSNAVKSVLGPDTGSLSMDKIHGKITDVTIHNSTFKTIITYHPAAILDRGDMSTEVMNNRKKAIWKDWQIISSLYKELKENQE